MATKYPKEEDGTYVRLNFSDFPNTVDSWQDSLDVSAEMLPYVNQYRNAMASNNLSLAQSILTEHPDLERMLFGAKELNELKHAVMAIERWCDENIEEYLGQFTDAAEKSAQTAASYATASQQSASASETSRNAAYQSQVAAEEAKNEADLLVENLRTLTGSLPSDFTEYVNDISGVREYVDGEIAAHNINRTAHEDIRQQLTKAQLDIRILYLHHETGITTNTFAVDFVDLDDVTVTKGTWDVANDRIWF